MRALTGSAARCPQQPSCGNCLLPGAGRARPQLACFSSIQPMPELEHALNAPLPANLLQSTACSDQDNIRGAFQRLQRTRQQQQQCRQEQQQQESANAQRQALVYRKGHATQCAPAAFAFAAGAVTAVAAAVTGSQRASGVSSTSISTASASRRDIVLAGPGAAAVLAQLPLLLAAPVQPAAASKLGGLVDSVWEDLGGGPADLTFPESWLGVWDVTSTLVSVELPLGEEVVPNIASVRRAQSQDLDRPLAYQVAFMRGPGGSVIFDRRFNTATLLSTYYGSSVDFTGRINWDPQDPNILALTLPGGLSVRTRVTRRSQSTVSDDRLETSEYLQQEFNSSDGDGQPRVKASQCFTKYKHRDEEAAAAANGPAIVATQVVSDYLTPYDGDAAFLRAGNRPVTTYTYRMAFTRASGGADLAARGGGGMSAGLASS